MVKQTRFTVHKYTKPQYVRTNSGLLLEAAKRFKEGLEADKKNGEIFKEKFSKLFKEDGINTTNAAGAYTTMLSSIMQTALATDEDLKTAESLVFVNKDMIGKTSFGAYQIPVMEPTVAVEVAEGAVINYFDEGVDGVTVTPKKSVVGTKITWEIKKRGLDGIVKWMLIKAKDALVRKRISDIVNGLAAGAGLSTTGGLSYAKFVEARQAVAKAKTSGGVPYNFHPDWFVVSSDYYANIVTDTDFKSAMYPANANPNTPLSAVGLNFPLKVGGCTIWETPMLTAAEALVLDSKNAGMLIVESDLEFFEGRLPKSPDDEILALESKALAIIYTKAVCKMLA